MWEVTNFERWKQTLPIDVFEVIVKDMDCDSCPIADSCKLDDYYTRKECIGNLVSWAEQEVE